MLKYYLYERDESLDVKGLIKKYRLELDDLCSHDKDTQDIFGFVNTWWVFGEVAMKFNYPVFMAEADNIGYKRTSCGEKQMLNDLYRAGNDNIVLVDDGIKTAILDHMRDIAWD